MSNNDLALQGISRSQAGNYSCTASNVEGDGDSNIVQLKVMCKLFYLFFLHIITQYCVIHIMSSACVNF